MKLISPLELRNNKDKFTIVDVREPYEYQFGNIGCENIPMAEVCVKITEKTLDTPLLLVCKSGGRASAVANYLETALQMSEVCVLEGGLQNWVELVEPTLILD